MPQKCRARKNRTARKAARELGVKIAFLEGLVRRAPDFVEAFELLGDHYTQCGRFEDGLRIDRKLSRLEPRNPLVFYNLACSCALTSRFDQAALALEEALSLGYRDFKWLARDPDLRLFRKHPLYRTIEDKIRRLKVSVGQP
jgi:tetratricopeptide (TPR) repeat protein